MKRLQVAYRQKHLLRTRSTFLCFPVRLFRQASLCLPPKQRQNVPPS